jgi:spore maturation protein CgeB
VTVLEENLAALDEVDPSLARRLRGQIDRSHLSIGNGGEVYYKRAQTPFCISLPKVTTGSGPGAGKPLFLFGIGAGEMLEQAASLHPALPFMAWERDPALLSLALSRVALANLIRSRRLRLLLGADLLDVLPLANGSVVALHPVLRNVYEEELLLLSRPLGMRRAIVCEGTLFVRELAGELRRRGFDVYPMHPTRLSREEMLRTCERVRPELVAAINFSQPVAELCAERSYKLLCWEVDPAAHPQGTAPLTGAADGIFAFTYRRSYVGELRQLGLHHVEQLPLAADPEVRKPLSLSPEQLAHYGAPVAFVGNSMIEDAPRFEALFLEQFCAHAGRSAKAKGENLLAEVLAAQRRDFGADRIAALLAPECRSFSEGELWRLARCASEIAAAERRLAYVSRLGRFGIHVWGDKGWRAAEAAGVTYRGTAKSYTDLTPIYCASTINLDIGRLHQLDIVTMRVFDVLACGGFVLAERSEDLGALFEIGREIACYSTLDELEHKVAHFLAHPEEARALAAAGREAVLSRHTISKRVGYMLERMGLHA